MKLDAWASKCFELMALSPSTHKVYKQKYNCRISPVFGHLEMDEISQEQVQLWILELSPSLAKWHLPILKSLFREAIKYGLCSSNPTDVKVPSYLPKQRDWMPWSELKELDFGRYTELVRFLALHGLRYSEALALTPEDVDQWVHINKSTHGPTTKGKKERKVPYLGHYQEFPRSYKWLRINMAKHGITPHSLRYTYAHLCKTQGIHPQVAQKLLGHSSITLTLDLYTRVLDDELEDAADKLRSA